MNHYLDFEYNEPSEAHMGLVSMAITDGSETRTYWLLDEDGRKEARAHLESIRGQRLVVYAAELAESRCVCALGLDPMDYLWDDLMLDWRWLRNSDDRWRYGRIIKGGAVAVSVPPPKGRRLHKKATRAEKEEYAREMAEWAEDMGADSAAEADGGLLDALVMFDCIGADDLRTELGVKKHVREHIIRNRGSDLLPMRQRILDYNVHDIARMPELHRKIQKAMEEALSSPHIILDPKFARAMGSPLGFLAIDEVPFEGGAQAIADDMGDWAARCGAMAMRGLDINPTRWSNIIRNAPVILSEIKDGFNRDWWPRYRVEDGGFARRSEKMVLPDSDDPDDFGKCWAKRVGSVLYPYATPRRHVEDYAQFEAWASSLERQHGLQWKRTDSGKYASDKEYLERMASDSDTDPIKAYLRCTKAVDAVQGLSKPDKGIPRTVGSDCIHRYAVDPYATQTSRNGQGASRFIYSAPHWMRALIDPPEGEVLIDLDYGSQEIFIGAALSGDANFMAGYKAGDPYWVYAVLTGAIPADIGVPTEEQRGLDPWKAHKSTRKAYKSTFLGIGFGMAAKSLSMHLSRDTGRPVDIDEAQGYIDGYNAAYPDYAEYRRCLQDLYSGGGMGLMLSGGWRMGPDNPVPNSYLNMPVQGHGAEILRRAVRKCQKDGITVRATMHDAITFSCREGQEDRVAARAEELMLEASFDVLGIEGMRVGAPEIVRHGEIWLHERGVYDWPKFEKFVMG